VRIGIGIPTYDTWKAAMALSLIGALNRLQGIEYSIIARKGCYLDILREECVQTALELKCDRLVFVDTDMMFPPEAIAQLLEAKKDIIGAAYNQKGLPLRSTVRLSDGKDAFLEGVPVPTQPFKCAAVATGLMAINMHRLTDNMAPPYFAYESAQRLKLAAKLGRGGEDVAFCVRAAECGLEVWCDPTIPVKHLGEFAY